MTKLSTAQQEIIFKVYQAKINDLKLLSESLTGSKKSNCISVMYSLVHTIAEFCPDFIDKVEI